MNIWPIQSECRTFYGDPYSQGWYERNVVRVQCPWKLYYGSQIVSGIAIHHRCAESLERVLNNIWGIVNKNQAIIENLRYHKYGGSYNLRPMRGNGNISMHGYACAIDWDPNDNPFHDPKHLFTDRSPLVEAFKAEGWIWGGDWSPGSVDAMHVQAARVHP